MSDLATVQRKAMRSLKDSRRPLFLQTEGSVWASTRIPIVAFAGYALGIYLLNQASLGMFSNMCKVMTALKHDLQLPISVEAQVRSQAC